MPKSPRTRPRIQSRVRKQIRNCRMYRWASQSHPGQEDFKVYGPYSDLKNYNLMKQAVLGKRKWFLVVTAYFLDENQDYYEEMLTFPAFGPLVFNEESADMISVIDQAVHEAKSSGEAAHYYDTCIAVYPYSPELERGFESDEFTKKRAEHRARVVAACAAPAAP